MRAYLTLNTADFDAAARARPDALILDAGAAHPGLADVPVFLRLGAVEAPGFATALRAATSLLCDPIVRVDPDAAPRPLGEGDLAQHGGVGGHRARSENRGGGPSVRSAATSPSGGGEEGCRPKRSSRTGVGPSAILLPVRHGRDVAQAGAVLAVHEAEHGWEDGATRIVALVASAAGAMTLPSLAGSSPRLAGIGWDAAALADELGCRWTDAAEAWSAPLAQVRAQVRLAAAAAGVEAIEAACPPDADPAAYAAAACGDGFGAVFARTAEAVAAIRLAAASGGLSPAR